MQVNFNVVRYGLGQIKYKALPNGPGATQTGNASLSQIIKA